MRKSKREAKSPQRDSMGLAETGIEAVAKTQEKALVTTRKRDVAVLQAVFLVAAVVVLLGGWQLYLGNGTLGFGALVVGVGAMVVGMVLLRPTIGPRAEAPRAVAAVPAGKTVWSRHVLDKAVSQETIDKLTPLLGGVRSAAQTQYVKVLEARKPKCPSIDKEKVRVNVFLPDCDDAAQGIACGLTMVAGLHLGIKTRAGKAAERSLRFSPKEGATGRAFTGQTAIGVRREGKSDSWCEVHVANPQAAATDTLQCLNDEQKALVNQELRWIISFPLRTKVDDRPETVGVMNVDGLSTSLTPDEMGVMYRELAPLVDSFDNFLRDVGWKRVAIVLGN